MRHSLCLAGCAAVAVISACAVLQPRSAPLPASQVGAASQPVPLRIAQATDGARTESGRAPPYVLCSGDACPRVTPKTLALASPAPTAAGKRDQGPGAASLPPQERTPPAAPAERRADISLTVHFRFGASDLSARAKALLDAAAGQALDTARTSRLRIVGRTDSIGPQAVNDALAMARARAVRDYLRPRLPRWPASVDIEASGACCYAADNDTSEGRLSNRRVEITWSASDPEAAP